MLVLIGRRFWTGKGRHPSCTAIIAKAFWKDLQKCWARRSLKTICHTALKLYRKSDKAEFYFPVCSLNLPLLTWGECQEYPGASSSVHGPIQHSSNCHFCLTLSFFFPPLEIALKITVHISRHVILQYKHVNFGQRKKHLSVMDSQISRTDLQ